MKTVAHRRKKQDLMGAHSSQKRLASTACWIAAVRAQESTRANRLFHDPWAVSLAGQEGQIWRERMTGGKEENEVGLVIRTRFFDDFLQRVTWERQVRQVVIVAAGMDTRAFRLPWPPHTRLFELDLPAVFERKEPLLLAAGVVPACQRSIVGVDLGGDWKTSLLQAGFTPDQRTVWLLEGLLFYLCQEVVERLFNGVTSLSPMGSWLGCESKNSEMLTSASTRSWIEALEAEGVPWISSMDHPEAFLAGYGWSATVVQPGEEGAHYGRWLLPVAPRLVAGVPRTFFVTALRSAS
jgi:methyltransferase (TIGR00027 family)